MAFTKSEKRVVNQIKRDQSEGYDFWLSWDHDAKRITYEGGFNLGNYDTHFRNEYTLVEGGKIRHNW